MEPAHKTSEQWKSGVVILPQGKTGCKRTPVIFGEVSASSGLGDNKVKPSFPFDGTMNSWQ